MVAKSLILSVINYSAPLLLYWESNTKLRASERGTKDEFERKFVAVELT